MWSYWELICNATTPSSREQFKLSDPLSKALRQNLLWQITTNICWREVLTVIELATTTVYFVLVFSFAFFRECMLYFYEESWYEVSIMWSFWWELFRNANATTLSSCAQYKHLSDLQSDKICDDKLSSLFLVSTTCIFSFTLNFFPLLRWGLLIVYHFLLRELRCLRAIAFSQKKFLRDN